MNYEPVGGSVYNYCFSPLLSLSLSSHLTELVSIAIFQMPLATSLQICWPKLQHHYAVGQWERGKQQGGGALSGQQREQPFA